MTTETPAPHDGDRDHADSALDRVIAWLRATGPAEHDPFCESAVVREGLNAGDPKLYRADVRALSEQLAAANERVADLPRIGDGITDAEAEASGTFDLTIDEVRSNSRYLAAIDENARLRRELAAANGRAEEAEAEAAELTRDRIWQAETERDSWKTLAVKLDREGKQLRARLDGLGEVHEEWGQKYSGGGYLTRVYSDWMRERWPIEQWAWDNTRHGGVVGKRKIIVVEDWREISSKNLPKKRPADKPREAPDATADGHSATESPQVSTEKKT